MTNPSLYHLDPAYGLEWFDVDDARKAARSLALRRREVEAQVEEHIATAATKEADYRRELAKRTAHYRAEKKGAGEAEVLAKGDVAHLSQERDHARDFLRLLFARLEGIDGERANFRQFCAWSESQQRMAA